MKSNQLIKQLGLALLGQALPEPSALSGSLDTMRKGLFATVVAGVLTSAVILLGCFSLYSYMVAEGLSNAAALLLSAAMLALIAIIFTMGAKQSVTKMEDKAQSLSFFQRPSSDSALSKTLNAFLDGLCSDAPPPTQTHKTYESDCRDRIVLVKN